MATEFQNLSDYDIHSVPNASEMRFGLVVAEWNKEITGNLLIGAYKTLLKNSAKEENIIIKHVPGTFELPSGAQMMLEGVKGLDAIICLGSVIRGETSHFDFVCQTASLGIKDVALRYQTPVIFGVLTDDTIQQALDRSGGKFGNKGDEAAVTAIKMAALKKSL